MNVIKCFLTNNAWYKEAVTNSKPIGILWHDTAAGNPKLSRYIQPSKSDENYNELIATIGKHKYNNHWNIPTCRKGVNAFIGKLADGSVGTVQIGEWDKAPWGCGSALNSIGSCNGYKIIEVNEKRDKEWLGQHWIQFEICDDGYKDETYFKQCVEEACQLTAHLCKLYDIDPDGVVDFLGVKVPTILCHKDAYKLKLGSDHSDTLTWFKKFGYSMDKVRARVAEIIKASSATTPSYKVGRYEVTGSVNLRAGSNTSTKIQTTLPKGAIVDVIEVDGTWGKTTYNDKTGYFGLKYAKYIGELPNKESNASDYQIGSYEITGAVNLRAGANTATKLLTTLQKGSVVDVVEIEGTWGKTTYKGKTGYFGLKYGKYLGETPVIKEELVVPDVKEPEVEKEPMAETMDVPELGKPVDEPQVETSTEETPIVEQPNIDTPIVEELPTENPPVEVEPQENEDKAVKEAKSFIQKILDFLRRLFS